MAGLLRPRPLGGARVALRLAVRSLARHRASALLLLATVATATTTLSVAATLGSVADQPWQHTRDLTAGPDVWVRASDAGRLAAATAAPGVVGAGAVRAHYLVSGLEGRRGAAAALVQVRDRPDAAIDRPALVAGAWARPGGIVVERAFAEALDVRPGDEVRIAGHRLAVAGIAVTTARAPYPSNTPGWAWVTSADGAWLPGVARRGFASVALRLADPAAGPALADRLTTGDGAVVAQPWQATHDYTVSDQRRVKEALLVGAWTLALLAIAGVAVLAGGRMADQRRRAGLLKAVGATPRLIAAVLLAEHLIVAVSAALVGLVAGRLLAPLLIQPSVGLADRPLSPTISPWDVALVLGMAVGLVCAATLPTAWRASRESSTSALASGVRPPRRSAGLVALSARLPVPCLIGVRLASRRPRRSVLSLVSLTITAAMVVAAMIMQYGADDRGLRMPAGPDFVPGAGNPIMERLDRATTVVMIALLALAALDTLLIAWASVLDSRRSTALLRALGANARQIAAGLVVAGLPPAALAGVLGIPLGVLVIRVASRVATVGKRLPLPPAGQLSLVPVGTVLVVALLMAWPAWAGSRRAVAPQLAAE